MTGRTSEVTSTARCGRDLGPGGRGAHL